MSATTAKIAARSKTENTGITPELADDLYHRLGSHQMAIVEFKVAERTEGDDDSQAVKLDITRVEPAADEVTEDHLHQLERALYFRRNPQPALTTGDPSEPTVTAVLDASGALVMNCAECEHKYADTSIAHTRGTTEDYPPCIWRECGHIVRKHEDDLCPKAHEADEDAA